MKKMLVLGAASALSLGVSAADMSWGGYAQIEAESGEGSQVRGSNPTQGRGTKFGAGYVRMGAKVDGKRHWGQMVFHNDGLDGDVGIKDLMLGLKCPKDLLNLKVGKFKGANGMDYTTSGAKLDIHQRGYDSNLVVGRFVGGELSGKIGMGLSYETFYGNPLTSNAETGTDNVYGLRLNYDRNTFHFEASVASDENAGAAGATNGDDAKYMDFAAKYGLGALTLKAEYANKELGNTSKSSIYAHVGYALNSELEFSVRHYMNSYEMKTSTATTEEEISNTWIGATYHVDPAARLRLNYVLVSGDDRDTKTTTSGTTTTQAWSQGTAYTANAILAQYQVNF